MTENMRNCQREDYKTSLEISGCAIRSVIIVCFPPDGLVQVHS